MTLLSVLGNLNPRVSSPWVSVFPAKCSFLPKYIDLLLISTIALLKMSPPQKSFHGPPYIKIASLLPESLSKPFISFFSFTAISTTWHYNWCLCFFFLLFCPLPHSNENSMKTVALCCLSLYTQNLEQCLTYSGTQSIITELMNK